MGMPLALKGQCHEIIFTSSHIILYCKLAAVAAAVAFSCGDGYTANLKGTVS